VSINLKVGSEFDEASARKAVAEAKAYYKKQVVSVRVSGEFHEVSARKAVADAKRYYAQQVVNVKVGGEFNDVAGRKAVADANRFYAQQDVQIKVGSDFNAVSARSAMAAARRYYAQQNVTINVNINQASISRALNQVSRPRTIRIGANTSGFDRGILGVLQRLNQIGAATRFSARGLATMAAPVVGLALIDIAKGAVTASQSIALLPAVVTSAASALGTLKLATLGFSEAIQDIGDPEKFATALQSLSPNAQQAALSIENLLPAFKELQMATQDAFFADFGQELNRLVTEYLPGVQQMTTTIADSFNQMVKGISDELMLPGTQAAMQEILTNIGSAFEILAPAARELVSAFVNLSATGSTFLPDLASAAADAAAAFSQFISDARESGKLQEFIQNGIDAVSTLASGLWELSGTIYEIFGSNGKKNVEDFGDTLEGINTVVATLGGNFDNLSADIQEEFALMTGPAAIFRDAILDIPEAAHVAANGLIDGMNAIKDSILNGPVKAINFLLQKFTELLNLGPGPDRPLDFGNIPEIPNIPHIPGTSGDWAPYRTNPDGNVGQRTPGKYRDRYGNERDIPTPGGGGNGRYPGPFNVPPPPPEKGSASGADKTPFVDPSKYLMGDPLAGAPAAIPGADPQKIYEADSKVITAQHNLEQGRLALQVLQEKGNATQQQILTAKNNIQEQERALYDAQADDIKARTTQMKQATSDLKDVFAPLDQDFGISKGLPGLIENLVKTLGNFALAGAIRNSPEMQAAALSMSSSGSGSGSGSGFGAQFGVPGSGSQFGIPGGADSNVNAMLALAQSSSGNVKYAPASDLINGLADCSGSVSDLYEVLKTGQSSPARAFSTTNFASDAEAAKLGFQPGFQPGAFNVGVNPYPGMSGHMAATLPNGVNFEGGGGTGGGAQYGGSAAGALDKQFQKHYFLPVGGPSSMGPGPLGGGVGAPPGWNGGGGGGAPPGVGSPGGGPGGSPSLLQQQRDAMAQYGTPADLAAFDAQHPGLAAGPGGGGNQPWNTGAGVPNIPGAGGGQNLMGTPQGPGAGASAGQGIQGHAPGQGGWQPAGGGFGGVAAIAAAGDAAGMAADAFAPGSGEAVKMGMKLANRAIGFGGQAAAIGIQGLGETFLPSGSEFADPLKSWPGRIAGGFAGAKPSTENKAGMTMPPAKPQNDVDPNTKEHGKGKGQPPGPAIGQVNFSSPVQDQQSMVRDIDRQTNAHGAGAGR
jgi:hypothetical protein